MKSVNSRKKEKNEVHDNEKRKKEKNERKKKKERVQWKCIVEEKRKRPRTREMEREKRKGSCKKDTSYLLSTDVSGMFERTNLQTILISFHQ